MDGFGYTHSQDNAVSRRAEEKKTAFRLLIKLRTYDPDRRIPSADLNCIRTYIGSFDDSLQNSVSCFRLLCESVHCSLEELLIHIHDQAFKQTFDLFTAEKNKKKPKKPRTLATLENQLVDVCDALSYAAECMRLKPGRVHRNLAAKVIILFHLLRPHIAAVRPACLFGVWPQPKQLLVH
jgi:hypothetical protein